MPPTRQDQRSGTCPGSGPRRALVTESVTEARHLDRLIERDVYLMERMFELRLRSSEIGLLFDQLNKTASPDEIGALESELVRDLQILRRRVTTIDDPVRRAQAEDHFERLLRASQGAGDPGSTRGGPSH